MKGVKSWWIVAAALVTSLGVLGVAHAAGDEKKAEMKAEVKEDPSMSMGAPAMAPEPTLVPGTTAGMPPTSQVLFCVVNADGSRARGFGCRAVVRGGVGRYDVTFAHDVAGCAYVGTIGIGGSGEPPSGEITVSPRAGVPAVVRVTTHTSGGALANRGFHLVVAC